MAKAAPKAAGDLKGILGGKDNQMVFYAGLVVAAGLGLAMFLKNRQQPVVTSDTSAGSSGAVPALAPSGPQVDYGSYVNPIYSDVQDIYNKIGQITAAVPAPTTNAPAPVAAVNKDLVTMQYLPNRQMQILIQSVDSGGKLSAPKVAFKGLWDRGQQPAQQQVWTDLASNNLVITHGYGDKSATQRELIYDPTTGSFTVQPSTPGQQLWYTGPGTWKGLTGGQLGTIAKTSAAPIGVITTAGSSLPPAGSTAPSGYEWVPYKTMTGGRYLPVGMAETPGFMSI